MLHLIDFDITNIIHFFVLVCMMKKLWNRSVKNR